MGKLKLQIYIENGYSKYINLCVSNLIKSFFIDNVAY